jgi:hypothetical protein
MPTTTMLSPVSMDSSQPISADLEYSRTLARLYDRMAIIDDLIRSLERYERSTARQGKCVPFRVSAPLKCS